MGRSICYGRQRPRHPPWFLLPPPLRQKGLTPGHWPVLSRPVLTWTQLPPAQTASSKWYKLLYIYIIYIYYYIIYIYYYTNNNPNGSEKAQRIIKLPLPEGMDGKVNWPNRGIQWIVRPVGFFIGQGSGSTNLLHWSSPGSKIRLFGWWKTLSAMITDSTIIKEKYYYITISTNHHYYIASHVNCKIIWFHHVFTDHVLSHSNHSNVPTIVWKFPPAPRRAGPPQHSALEPRMIHACLNITLV